MKKKELLSPVGNKMSLIQAIHNGADAVYMAGKSFGAREYAENFNNSELIDAIKYCHLYGVKIYITINTLIDNNEVDTFLDYVDFLYNNNVDAVIMQDIGMIKKVRSLYPDLEIHASTQVHNNSIETLKLLKKLGVKRVVMARELSLDEINKFDLDIEKEIFIHGALCISYSGNCLFSSMHGNRSGNKGRCTGPCRLEYELLKNNEIVKTPGSYLLSTKELNTVDYLDKILMSNVDSLKIEGRMKSPEYVGFITRIYRKKIDAFYNNEKYYVSEDELNKMKLLYNRDYTKGHLFNSKNDELMNIKTSNHQGILLGKVIDFSPKKIKIKLFDDLNQEDGIRFLSEDKGMIINKLYNEKGLLVNSLRKNDIAILDNKLNISMKQNINKTIGKNLINELNNISYKKIGISFNVYAKVNEKLKISIVDDDGNSYYEFGGIIENAISSVTTEDNIYNQLSKLGNTPFKINNISYEIDNNIFISLKEINYIRRCLVNKLIDYRENKKVNRKLLALNLKNKLNILENTNINVSVRNEEQLKACIDSNVDNIYIHDEKLYNKYKSSLNNIYLILNRTLKNYKDYKYENLVVRELGSINMYSNHNNLVSCYTLNVVNNETVHLLTDLNVKRICVSPEVKISDLKYFEKNNLEYVVYGRIELMIMKYCPLNYLINKDKKCNLCHSNDFYSIKRGNNIFPLINTNSHETIVMNDSNIDYITDIKEISKYINNFRVDLFDENYNNTKMIIERIRNNYERRN